MIISSKVIVLRCIDYQESSRIITVLSEQHGKIALLAKGVKKPKNKLAGVIEIGNILDVVYYYKSSRGIQTLSEASINYQSLSFRSDFKKASILFATLELTTQLVHEGEENPDLYLFLEKFITWLGNEGNAKPGIFAYVQIRLANLIGFGLVNECSGESETVYLNISSGTLSHRPDSELSYKLSPMQASFIVKALQSRQKGIFDTEFRVGELKQLIHHFDVYFKYHIEGYKDRKSDSIFEQLMQEQQ